MRNYAQIIQEFLSGCNQKGVRNTPTLYEAFSPKVIANSPLGKHAGVENLMDIHANWYTGFPDIHSHCVNIEQYETTVFAAIHTKGTHLFPFQGITATKKMIQFLSQLVFCFEDEKIVRYSAQADMIQLYDQLGLHLAPQDVDPQKISQKDKALLMRKIQKYFSTPPTNREIEILSLHMTGIPLEQIGLFYSLPQKDIEMHLATTFEKLGCTNKKQFIENIKTSWMMPLIQDLGNLLLHNP